MNSNTSGIENTAMGAFTMGSVETGSQNTATGMYAMFFNVNGNGNTALGNRAMYDQSSGIRNSFVGHNAGINSISGSYNSVVGAYASFSGSDFSNSVAIGDAVVITASNQIRLGDTGVTSIGGYTNWSNISDKRFKKNIKTNIPGLEFIMLLEPVSYSLNTTELNEFLGVSDQDKADYNTSSGKEDISYSGFLAQDVEAAARSVGYDFSGVDAPANDKDTYGLRYAEFVVPMVQAIKEQQQMIEELKAEIETLKSQINK
jgi:hypothetical protein